MMVKTFNAILTNNAIQWLDKTPELNLDSSVKVQITFLEQILMTETKSNGQKMAESLRKISKNNTFTEIDPSQWQEEIRQDRHLPNRD